jgi:septum site-determining protein MinC
VKLREKSSRFDVEMDNRNRDPGRNTRVRLEKLKTRLESLAILRTPRRRTSTASLACRGFFRRADGLPSRGTYRYTARRFPVSEEAASVESTRSVLSTNLDLGLKDPADLPRPAAIDIRYGQIGLVQLRIRTMDTGAILDELTGRIATAPNFFRRTAVSLDLSDLDETPDAADMKGVIDAVRRAGMMAVGLAANSGDLEPLSSALSLPILTGFRPSSFPGGTPAAVTPQAAPAPAPAVQALAPVAPVAPAEPAPFAMIQQQTVRSGQRIYARHRDLIVTAGVGAGSEVIADGCIHVYGSLRGRALAGVHGQLNARVFCQEFHAELVSIAGVFRVFETIPAELAGKPVQAWLDGEKLHFARVGG